MCVYLRMYVSMYVCIHQYGEGLVLICVGLCVRACVCTSAHTYTEDDHHSWMDTGIYIYIYTYIHTYIYTHEYQGGLWL
jgi:hypothetical protein